MRSAFTLAERRQNPPTVVLTQWLRKAMLSLAGSAIAAQRRARTRRILGSLDEAGLKDIGLVRSQVEGIERDPRYTRAPS